MTKSNFQFFATTGRDEFYEDNDQLYHEGIDLDRTQTFSKNQEAALQHRSLFAPNYDETRILHSPL